MAPTGTSINKLALDLHVEPNRLPIPDQEGAHEEFRGRHDPRIARADCLHGWKRTPGSGSRKQLHIIGVRPNEKPTDLVAVRPHAKSAISRADIDGPNISNAMFFLEVQTRVIRILLEKLERCPCSLLDMNGQSAKFCAKLPCGRGVQSLSGSKGSGSDSLRARSAKRANLSCVFARRSSHPASPDTSASKAFAKASCSNSGSFATSSNACLSSSVAITSQCPTRLGRSRAELYTYKCHTCRAKDLLPDISKPPTTQCPTTEVAH
jgi:hypothetical protein